MCWIDAFEGRLFVLITEQVEGGTPLSHVAPEVVDIALGLAIDEVTVRIELAELCDDGEEVRRAGVERRLWRQIAARWRECRDSGGYPVLRAWMQRVRELATPLPSAQAA